MKVGRHTAGYLGCWLGIWGTLCLEPSFLSCSQPLMPLGCPWGSRGLLEGSGPGLWGHSPSVSPTLPLTGRVIGASHLLAWASLFVSLGQ